MPLSDSFKSCYKRIQLYLNDKELAMALYRNRRHIGWYVLLLVCISCFLFACGNEEKRPTPIPIVTYTHVLETSTTLSKTLPGRTSAFVISEIRPQITGIVKERLFTEGSDVKEGDVLYKIDPSLYQSEYDRAKADLKNAEAILVSSQLLAERRGKLAGTKAISLQEYDDALAAYKQAQAHVDAAKAKLNAVSINLGYTKITAPVSGRIGHSNVTLGALVTQNQTTPLTTIQQLDPIYVDVTESSARLLQFRNELLAGRLRPSEDTAMDVYLVLENGQYYSQYQPVKDPDTGKVVRNEHNQPQYSISPVIGQLKFTDITVDESTGSVRLRAVFPNPEGVLLPGMYVRAMLEEGQLTRAILVPQRAVSRNNRGLPYVRILVPQKKGAKATTETLYDVEQRIVEIDRSIDNQWLISNGLRAGEKLIVDGFAKIKVGQPVKAKPLQRNAPTPPNGSYPTSETP